MKHVFVLVVGLVAILLAGCTGRIVSVSNVTPVAATIKVRMTCSKGEAGRYWLEHRRIGANGRWTKTNRRSYACPNAARKRKSHRVVRLSPATAYEVRLCADPAEWLPPFCTDENGTVHGTRQDSLSRTDVTYFSFATLRSPQVALRAGPSDPAPPPGPPSGPPDTTPPDTTIASGPSGTVTATDASFQFASSETGSSFQCRLDGAAFAACSSPRSYTGLTVGEHAFEVRATDQAGNPDQSPASRTWTIQAPRPADQDADGVPDSVDYCSSQPGPASNNGCPVQPLPTSCTNTPCFDWLGATFSGVNDNHVPHAAHDMAVSADGYATTGAVWVESAHDQRVFRQDGSPTGSCPHNSAGRFRENGGGPRGVEIDDTHVFAVQGRNLVRWDRNQWLTVNRCDAASPRGQTLNLGGAGDLLGVSVTGGEAFVTDAGQNVSNTSPATATIKVFDANLTGGVRRRWTVPHARQTTVDRQGNLWVLQQRTGSSVARLARYTPTGVLLNSYSVTGEPMDIAASRVADEVLVPDNGQDQRVERYDYAGTLVGTLGQSYLSGPTPGLLGPQRFSGPRGVDVDSSGNVYVTQTCNPGRAERGWQDDGFCMILSKHQPDGNQVWRVEGNLAAAFGEPTSDGSRFHAAVLTFDRTGPSGRWATRAVSVDPFAHPNDPRWSDQVIGFQTTTATSVRDVGGQRLVATERDGGYLRVFRMNGEIQVPITTIGNPGGTQDYSIADNGDVWQARGGQPVSRYPYQPASVSFGARQDLPLPPGFVDVKRIEVEANTVTANGYGPGEFAAGFDDWKWSGKRLARFTSLPTTSGWPAPAWSRQIHWAAAWPDRPVGMAVDDDRIAVAYLANGNGGDGYVRVLRASDGSEERVLNFPHPQGWYDMFAPLSFVNDVIYGQENEIGKQYIAELGP